MRNCLIFALNFLILLCLSTQQSQAQTLGPLTPAPQTRLVVFEGFYNTTDTANAAAQTAVDGMVTTFAGQPVIFLDYDYSVVPVTSSRVVAWQAASGSATLPSTYPMTMLDSDHTSSTSTVDVTNYTNLIKTELTKAPQAWLNGSCLRQGNRIRFNGYLINKNAFALSADQNPVKITIVVYEDTPSGSIHRLVRASSSMGLQGEIAPDQVASFSMVTDELATAVNWKALHCVLLAETRPTGSTGAFTMMQACLTRVLGVSDFNADGSADLLWENQSTYALSTWLMNGEQIASTADLADSPGRGLVLGGTADFNLDGKTDIVWRQSSTGANYLWVMDGINLVQKVELEALPDPNWKIAAIVDFNLDGFPDLVWRNYATGENMLWYMFGSIKLGTAVLPAVPDTHWVLVGATDMGQDLRPDLVWHNAATGENSVWHMYGPQILTTSILKTWNDPNWGIALVADMDGDGRNDLFWRNQANGENVVWRLKGTLLTYEDPITPNPDTQWQLSSNPFEPVDIRVSYDLSESTMVPVQERSQDRK
jgi:hypothetical protein